MSNDWWRDAVIYQVYPRSFYDSDGDGLGDIPGIRAKLDHLQSLGVDAIWVSPFYESPLNDGGYDVADYTKVDPRLGTLEDVDALIADAHARGMRFFMDIVPNHTSTEHRWFKELLDSEPGSEAWDRYIVREGRGPDRSEPPNNWRSIFHGEAWTPLPSPTGGPSGYWYLNLFDSTQADLNWNNPSVRSSFEDILRFWFDRGVDGFRIDVAHGLVKADGLPDFNYPDAPTGDAEHLLGDGIDDNAPWWDQDGVHEIYRKWRAVADSYDPPKVFCGETVVRDPQRLALYQRPDELHTSFNFVYLEAGWDAKQLRSSIDDTIENHRSVGAPPTWVLSNHDVVRHSTRYAPSDDGDVSIGQRRAIAGTLFTLGLPGSAYLYQGEELGLYEVTDLPDSARFDPAWHRSEGTEGFRDGCRVPLPWEPEGPTHGFSKGAESWLPQPEAWRSLASSLQEKQPDSTLHLYRRMLAIRKAEASMGEGPLEWIDSSPQILVYRRVAGSGGRDIVVAMNTGAEAASLPADMPKQVLIESAQGCWDGAMLAPDSTIWLSD